MHPDDHAARVSHETIYAAIYAQPRSGLKAAMIEALRQGKPVRGLKRTTLAGSAMIPEALRIINRPEEIEGRLVPGHWEGDLIKGAFNRSSVGTLVERKTRFVVLCKMNGNDAEAVLDSFTRQMKRLPAALRKCMTYDRGSEMACHPELASRLKIDIWFCDPHAPLSADCFAIACRAMPGSVAATRTPTACCANSCPKAQTSAMPAKPGSTTSQP
jgi:IS30 family transposase